MKLKIQGLILSKIPFKERHLIGDVLLRSGKKISVIFLGGRGGGVNKKSSVLEIGHMLEIELKRPKNIYSEQKLLSTNEWNLIWSHKKIRHHYKSFELGFFYLSLIRHLAIEDDLSSKSDHKELNVVEREHDIGYFRLLSNAFYYLDHDLEKNQELNLNHHLIFFLVRLIEESGHFPVYEKCIFCDQELSAQIIGDFSLANGGLSCFDCCSKDGFLKKNQDKYHLFFYLFHFIPKINYREMKLKPWEELASKGHHVSYFHAETLFHYFCLQNQLDLKRFKIPL